ncbi:glycoside hydrolase family 3 protein [Halodesulfovibrio aestuarii]|uniref:Beta-N-acetylhexosaminidase n=1 Tax=Halodesulfovibrio aestuarii TaxID=126333 RepID=A0A8G2C757_9BACT|nr:glycoside hydrolase family 3 N-terminal domain-containing protein [Halodesulfovibrio aestuarii]SHI57835.1 beta-N-acetylhexosaminidase [Halodesulfovibrio aestuarii]
MPKILAYCVLLILLATQSFAMQATELQSPEVSLKTMIGQMIMVGFRGEGATTARVLLRDIKEHQIGGVILFDKDCLRPQAVRNIISKEQVHDLISALQDVSTIPLFVAIDQEGGRVSRFKPSHGFAGTPSAQKLGELPVSETFAAGEHTGAYLESVGVNMNFAPVLDVNVNPESPVIGAIERSYSADPSKVATYGHAFAQGMARHGIISGYKHFPGHGSSLSDSHKGLPDVTKTWSKDELIPYAELLGKEPLHVLMVGHLYNRKLDADTPTSLSYPVITEVLRDQLGYDGVVVTDDLQMKAITNEYPIDEAAVKAVQAGSDILLAGNNLVYDPQIVCKLVTALTWAVHNGELPIERIRQSYERIMKLKRESGLFVEEALKE